MSEGGMNSEPNAFTFSPIVLRQKNETLGSYSTTMTSVVSIYQCHSYVDYTLYNCATFIYNQRLPATVLAGHSLWTRGLRLRTHDTTMSTHDGCLCCPLSEVRRFSGIHLPHTRPSGNP